MNGNETREGATAAKWLVVVLVAVAAGAAGGYFGTRAHTSQSNAAPVTPPAPTPAPSAAPAPKAVDPELLASALSVQMSVRSQLELYRLQHADQWPDLKAKGWDQLTSRTENNGTITEKGIFGPYFQKPPVNPLNNLGTIAAVEKFEIGKLPTAAKGSAAAGFLRDPVSGRIWITDAAGTAALDEDAARATLQEYRAAHARQPLGSVSDLSPAARRRALDSTLAMIRSQIELYKLQHLDIPPDLERYPNWAQLLQKTEADGRQSADARFGPYLRGTPVNPLNGLSTVCAVSSLPAFGTMAPGGKRFGFYYEQSTGRVAATDETFSLVHDESLRIR